MIANSASPAGGKTWPSRLQTEQSGRIAELPLQYLKQKVEQPVTRFSIASFHVTMRNP
jgi:hypothetical protein